MNEQVIISKMHGYLHTATKELCAWLGKMLPRVSEDWWQICVMDNLSFTQKQYAEENGYSKLEDLDLAAMLRVADKSWYDMRAFAYLWELLYISSHVRVYEKKPHRNSHLTARLKKRNI